MRRITIKDVAKEAGVAISTVSNALNNAEGLSQETREYILEIVEKMHYIPNLSGRNLKVKETKVIGLFIPTMKGSYFVRLADVMYNECLKNGYELNIFITQKNISVMENILGKRVDGAVILNRFITENNVERLIKEEVPVVFLDREAIGKKVSSVIFDSYETGRQAANYLVGLGYRKLGHIRGVIDTFDSDERLRGFKTALEEAGMLLKDEYILNGSFERDTARQAVRDFLEAGIELPEAIFASNDLSAIGCAEAFIEAGIRIPEEVGIIGCDDIELCERFTPTMSTISTSFMEQGIAAIHQLLDIIADKKEGEIKKLTGQIIARNSLRKKVL